MNDVDDIKDLDFILIPEEKFTEDIGNQSSFSQPKRTLITVKNHRTKSFTSKLLRMNLNYGAYMFSYDTNKGEVFDYALDSLMFNFLF